MWASDINVNWKIDAIEYFMILCSLGVVHICQVSRQIVQDFLTKLEANPENPMHIISELKSVYKCRASLFLFVWPSSLKRNITKNVLNGFERDCWMSYSGLYIYTVYIVFLVLNWFSNLEFWLPKKEDQVARKKTFFFQLMSSLTHPTFCYK